MGTFSTRVENIQPSQTLAVTARVDALRRQGRDIIDLGAGEPDFHTPEVIKQEAIRAIQDGFTKYTPSSGILELKEAICAKLLRDNNLHYAPSQIIVTCGAKHAIVNILLALCQQDDEVILPSPYWTSYYEQIRFVEATPVIIPTEESLDFKIRAEQLEKAINSKSKLLILNSPCNPTGSVYTYEELAELVELIKRSQIYVLSDEIYEKIVYDGQNHVSLASFPEIKEKVVLVNGVSKAFAMTGWRIGYLAAEEQTVVNAVAKIQSHSTSNPCSISQRASVAALMAGDEIIRPMVSAFDRRRKYLTETLNQLPGVSCKVPKGAFYVFANISRCYGLKFDNVRIDNSFDFCTSLLEEEGVALVPGEAFGSRQHVRISYATSLDILGQAMERMSRWLHKLHAGT